MLTRCFFKSPIHTTFLPTDRRRGNRNRRNTQSTRTKPRHRRRPRSLKTHHPKGNTDDPVPRKSMLYFEKFATSNNLMNKIHNLMRSRQSTRNCIGRNCFMHRNGPNTCNSIVDRNVKQNPPLHCSTIGWQPCCTYVGHF